MRTEIRMVARQLRVSKVTRFMPLVVMLGGFIAWATEWEGLFIWQNRAQSTMTALALVIPVLAVLAAWDGASVARAGLRSLWRMSVGHGVRAVGVLATALSLIAVASFTLIAVFAHLPIGVKGVPPGAPVWEWLVAGALACVVGALLGLMVGLAASFLVTVLVTPLVVYAATAYLVVVAADAGGPRTDRLSPTYQEVIEPFFVLQPAPFVVQAAWFAALAVTLIGACIVLVAPRLPWAWFALAASVTLAVITASGVVHDGRSTVHLRQAQAFHCEGIRPELCITPEYEQVRVSLSKPLGDLSNRLAGTPLDFSRVEVRPRGVLGEASLGAVALHVDDLSSGWQQRDLAELMEERLSNAPGGFCAGLEVRDPEGREYGAAAVVIAWAAGEPTVVSGEDAAEAALRRFTSMSSTDRSSWLSVHRVPLCRGTLSLSRL